MKLYATTTSRTTAKGIGDDKCLEIELKHGNRRIARLSYSLYRDEPYLEISADGVTKRILLNPLMMQDDEHEACENHGYFHKGCELCETINK